MNLAELFRQANEMQAKAKEMQARLAEIEAEGVSGAGLVRVTLNGKSELTRIAIDPSLLRPEDLVTVQDLVVAAHADARAKLERSVADAMKSFAGSLGLPPGLGLPT
jgi:hypothetical protein